MILVSQLTSHDVEFHQSNPYPHSRLRTILPDAGYKGLVENFHSHVMTAAFNFTGGKTEFIAGHVDCDVWQSGDTDAKILSDLIAQQYADQIRTIPTDVLAIFGPHLWHRSSRQTPQEGLLIAESFRP